MRRCPAADIPYERNLGVRLSGKELAQREAELIQHNKLRLLEQKMRALEKTVEYIGDPFAILLAYKEQEKKYN